MFTIIPCSALKVRVRLGAFAVQIESLLSHLTDDDSDARRLERPFVQLAHWEIEVAEVNIAFGYAGIPDSLAPIGLPYDISAFSPGEPYLLFPLIGLAAHLRAAAPLVVDEFDHLRDLDRYLMAADRSAFEYLVAGTLECIEWCVRTREALEIRW